jgi:DNA-binding CsgD family transcriptional regulator
LWDDDAWDVLCTRQVQLVRDAGALGMLFIALRGRIALHLHAGELAAAASLIEEVQAVAEATGSSFPPYAALARITFQGREAEATQVIKASTRDVVRRGEGQELTFIHWLTAVLHNGLGRYAEALAAAQQAAEDTHASWWRNWGLVELIEAAARSAKPELAADALGQLSQTTTASGTDWALGVEARSRALLTEGEAAEPRRPDPQEAQISRLAADGATNQEIAAQLFISPNTVDYHLRKAFRKLGVKSRHQLKQHLLQPPPHADPPLGETDRRARVRPSFRVLARRGDVDRALGLGHPPAPPPRTETQGAEMMKHAFPDIKAHIQDIFAAEDRVALRLTFRSTHSGEFQGLPGPGRSVEYVSHGFYRVPDGSPRNESAQTQPP